MKTLRYTLSFTTPAFMGNAEQNAQWRTPPIKALLRQWWRVAYAAEKKFAMRVDEMRHEEGLLFGHAWLENDTFEREGKPVKTAARKSEVRIRLVLPERSAGTAWGAGTQQGVAPLSTGLDTSYAWFGLVKRGDGQSDRNAIAMAQNESKRILKLAIPDTEAIRIQTVMQLIAAFGQLGSRSRGGWGSFQLESVEALTGKPLKNFSRPLAACLLHDWPMSLCTDTQGLCLWESIATYPSWDNAMRVIATERRNARLALKSVNGRDLRPVLGFATGDRRMPNPLRWRLGLNADQKLVIRVFAMPSKIPDAGKQNITEQQLTAAWQTVIATMDKSKRFKRGTQ